MARLVGVVPALLRRGAMGGAPAALLPTGKASPGTFLARAVTLLREAGADPLFTLVPSDRDPVAAAALREGCRLLVVDPEEAAATLPHTGGRPSGHRMELAAILQALSTLEIPGASEPEDPEPEEGIGEEGGAGDPPPRLELLALVLPPTLALVDPATLTALVRASRAHPRARAWVPLHGARGEAAPPGGDDRLLPRLLRIPLPPPDRRDQGPPDHGIPDHDAPDRGMPGHGTLTSAEWEPEVAVPVSDPHLDTSIETLPLYRRHFPQAARQRFQKW